MPDDIFDILNMLNNPPSIDYINDKVNNFYSNTGNYSAEAPLKNKKLNTDGLASFYKYKKAYDQDNIKVFSKDATLIKATETSYLEPEVIIYGNKLKDSFSKAFSDFELVLFANSDGAIIFNHFDLVEPEPNQLILFLEINDKTNYFGSVLRVKLGDNIIESKLPFLEIYEFTKEHQVKISSDEIKELITTGNLKNKFRYLIRLFNKLSRPLNYLSGILFEKMGDTFKDTIPDFLNRLKIKEERWNPEAEGYHPLFGSLGLELLVAQSQRAKVKPDHHFKVDQKKVTDLFDEIESKIDVFYKYITLFFPNKLNRRFHTVLRTLNKKLNDARKVFNDTDWLVKLLKLGTQMYNAYICGIINGFIDAINGIFQLIGLVCYAIAALNKGASDILFATSMLIEVFENIFEAIVAFDLIGFLWKCIKLPFKFVVGIYNILKQITTANLKKLLEKLGTSLPKIAYVCGNIVGFIIQLVLEALCTGGVAAVEDLIKTLFKLLRNPAETIASGIKGVIKVSKEFFSNLLYKLSKFFESLKSKTAFKALDEWVNDILAAIKKELGISDEVLKTEGLFSKIIGKPISKELLIKLQDEFRLIGGEMRFDEEGFEYIAFREKTLGTKIEAITLSEDLIILNKDSSISAVYEELIHARQFKSGLFNKWAKKYGNEIAENLMEKEAAEELIKDSKKLNLPKEEIQLIKERLDFFNEQLKVLKYEK